MNAAKPQFNGPLAQFKVQGSRFSDLKVQSDQRVDDKVRAALNCGEAALNFEP
jgi:hypothetical protein